MWLIRIYSLVQHAGWCEALCAARDLKQWIIATVIILTKCSPLPRAKAGFWEHKSFTSAVRAEMNLKLWVGLATFSSCILCSKEKILPVPANLNPLTTTWAVSQPQEDNNQSLTLQKQMPSSEGAALPSPPAAAYWGRMLSQQAGKVRNVFSLLRLAEDAFLCPPGLQSPTVHFCYSVGCPAGRGLWPPAAEESLHPLLRAALSPGTSSPPCPWQGSCEAGSQRSQ